jgi:hypothetical protein
VTVTHAQIQIFLTSEGFAVMGAGVDAVAQLVERGQDAKQVPVCCRPLIACAATHC